MAPQPLRTAEAYRNYSVIIFERIALSTMGEQLQMQLCGIITLESILCNCALNTDIDL